MKWYKHLYVGDSIAAKEDKIKWKIKHNAGMPTIYIIAIASNPKNLLDLIPSRELLQRGYPKRNLLIVGLADGYQEAVQVAQTIIQDTYQTNGNVDVYHYLMGEKRSIS
jgi:hypothetical protein